MFSSYSTVFLTLFSLYLISICTFGDEVGRLQTFVSEQSPTQTPRLEDFFWTGSGDGPPPPGQEPPVLPPPTPVILTTTVLATVYLDSYPPQTVTDRTTGECVMNCEEDTVPGSLAPDTVPDDRRYWLLTVIRGSTPDSLQLRLARLYQKAFLRQQERHLGIIKSLDAPTTRKKHEVHSFLANSHNGISLSNTEGPMRYHEIQSSMIDPQDIVTPITNTRILDSTIIIPVTNLSNFDITNTSQALLRYNDFFPVDFNESVTTTEIKTGNLDEVNWILATPTVDIVKREITADREELLDEYYKEDFIDISLEEGSNNETVLFKREIIKPEQQPPVHVHIQNITEHSETGSVQIVYVVMVGGRAVPAAVAARDMRLVRDAEVAKELGATVTTKAEPYLKAAEGLAGAESAGGFPQESTLWALGLGAAAILLLVLLLIALLCRLAKRKKTLSAASLTAYRNEMMREIERNQLRQVHEEKDGRLVSVVSPSRTRTRPSSTLMPVYRAPSATASSSSSSSGMSEVAAALRRRQKKPHALRMPQKKRVGTTDSLLAAAGLGESSDGSRSEQGVPQSPTSYLSMPSVRSFPRGNVVEPLSRVLEPVSVRHLDIDSPSETPKVTQKQSTDKPKLSQEKVHKRPETGVSNPEAVPRRQMASQLVRLGSIDKDPGVVGPLVWDLHCQRVKDASKQTSPAKTSTFTKNSSNVSRMRQRFNELVDDALSLFGSPASSPTSPAARPLGPACDQGEEELTQARNDNVQLPGSPNTARDTLRGRSAGLRPESSSNAGPSGVGEARPMTSFPRAPRPTRRPPPTRAWDQPQLPPRPTVNPAFVLSEGRLPPEDPALPLISAIKSEIQRVREHSHVNDT